jgi:hypothetical protein
MTPKELLDRSRDPAFQGSAKAWAASEMTALMLGMAEARISARRLASARAEDALFHSGYIEGGRDTVLFLQAFGETAEAEEKRRAAAALLQSTYGAGEPPKKEKS